jgi:hypothetical protein
MIHQDIVPMTDIGLAASCIIQCHSKECRFSKIMASIRVRKCFHLRITTGIIARWSLAYLLLGCFLFSLFSLCLLMILLCLLSDFCLSFLTAYLPKNAFSFRVISAILLH